jgi:RecA/RadA recombinase
LVRVIRTGSISLDHILGGGIRTGIVTDIYGQSGAGKSQLCFTLCANCARHLKQGEMIMFVDTVGTFRPERISEIARSEKNDNINKIMLLRALSTADQINATKKIADNNLRLVIIDSATSLFSNEFKGASRHLALMKYLHGLSLAAIDFDCAIVITNMVRNVPLIKSTANYSNNIVKAALKPAVDSLQQREFMGTSVSIYAHIRLKLEVVNPDRSLFGASMIQPMRKKQVYFTITARGVSD